MPKSTKGASAPKFVVVRASQYTTFYTGTKEQLIAGGFARPEQFPEGRKRKKFDYSMDNFFDGWAVKKLKGDLFELRNNHDFRHTQSPVALEKFELRHRPDLDGKYEWKLLQGRWSTLDEQSHNEISSAIWDIVEAVENAQARARKNHLELVRPVTATGGAR